MNFFKTRIQIAAEFGITVKTFNAQLKKHGLGIPPGAIYPKDQERIYTVLGRPISSDNISK
jgi:hypothetical protein